MILLPFTLAHTSSILMGALHARMIFTLADSTSIPIFGMYLHARMFCTLAGMSSIPMGVMSELQPVLSQCSQTSFVTVDDFIALYTHSISSIPMSAIHFYMQEHFFHSLISLHQFLL